jgi:hypothetical protein
VTVGCELAREPQKDPYGNEIIFYKVTWNIHEKNQQGGAIFIINSFSLNAG